MWQIEIKIGKRFEVLEEGPFDTREAAVAFAEAEVSGQWRVTQRKGEVCCGGVL